MIKLFSLFAILASTAYQATPDAPKCTLALSETIVGNFITGAKYSDNMALSEAIETN